MLTQTERLLKQAKEWCSTKCRW